MAKKFFSLIIVPHNRGKFKTITLSEKKVKILIMVFTLLFTTLTIFLIDYFSMNVTRQKYRELFDENSRQKQAIAKYKVSINKLKADIDDFEAYANKINVMAGLKAPEVLKEVGLGGGDRGSGQEIDSSNYSQDAGLNRAQKISRKADGIDKNLNTLVKFFEEQTAKLASTPTIWPTTGWLVSAYGSRTDPFTGKSAFHYGLDIASSFGNPVVATADGFVSHVKREKIGGNTVIISHGGGFTTVYCHLSKFAVKAGQRIKRWDVIGYIGQTGKALGPHVHYEVRRNGKAVNPYKYILEE
ncbi:MAG: peptidoglycan DD-metalloendopeptidase family protein [Candidatus Aminicenantes bacterium]|nr:peptidoglycan DD-metalloendopeptidase family protein [Candidatus Aminicenantes bacterium]